MTALRAPLVEQHVRDLLAELDDPRSAALLSPQVVHESAQRFGIAAKADLRELLVLLKEAGPDFEDNPDHRWIVTALADPDVTNASARLQRIRDLRQRQQAISASNSKAERRFAKVTAMANGAGR